MKAKADERLGAVSLKDSLHFPILHEQEPPFLGGVPAAGSPPHAGTVLHSQRWVNFFNLPICQSRKNNVLIFCAFSFFFCFVLFPPFLSFSQKRSKRLDGENIYIRHSNLMLEVCMNLKLFQLRLPRPSASALNFFFLFCCCLCFCMLLHERPFFFF